MDREKKKELLKKYKDGNVTRFRKTKGGGKEYYNLNDYKRKDKESENESKIINKKLIRLIEGDLHRIVKESARRIIREIIGNSSPNGYEFDYETGQVKRNQGGAFGGSELVKARDYERYLKL